MIVKLMEFLISVKTNLWEDLWGNFQTRLFKVGRFTMIVGNTMPWTRVPDWMWPANSCCSLSCPRYCRPFIKLWCKISTSFLKLLCPGSFVKATTTKVTKKKDSCCEKLHDVKVSGMAGWMCRNWNLELGMV